MTPTGEAIMASLRRLALRPEPKKLMFVITDGDPDSVEDVEEALDACQTCNVTVVAFGIGSSHISGFDNVGYVTVNDVSELHLAVKDAISQSLLS